MENDIQNKVQTFIKGLSVLSEKKYKILMELRELVSKTNPDVQERMMYGGIMFSLTEDLGGVFVYKQHISFEFGNGYMFKDPDQLLQGNGKFRRHLKIKDIKDQEFVKADFYISQMFSKAE